LNACYRGCRLFSICHFVDADAELNTTRAECEADPAANQAGCRFTPTGCKAGGIGMSWGPELKVPSFSMFDLVSTFCNDIVSSAQSFISSTWTFYLQADDGKVVVFQVGVSRVPSPRWVPRRGGPSCSPFSPSSPADPPVPARAGSQGGSYGGAHLPASPRHDWVGLLGLRCGRTVWSPATTLGSLARGPVPCSGAVQCPLPLFQPLSINGDKEYLEDLDSPGTFPLPPVIAVTLCPTHGREDAGPLPLKVDLDKTIL
ncbi:Transmembrane protein 59, partial [Charadrius vociferus]